MQDDALDFVRVWEQLDPYGTSYISVKQLTTLITMVGVRCISMQYIVCECVCVCVCVCAFVCVCALHIYAKYCVCVCVCVCAFVCGCALHIYAKYCVCAFVCYQHV